MLNYQRVNDSRSVGVQSQHGHESRGSCHNKLLYCTSAWGKIWRAPCTGKAETAETGVEGDAIGKRGDHVAVGQFGLQCSTTGDGK